MLFLLWKLFSQLMNLTLIVGGIILIASCIWHPSFERSTTGILFLLLAKED
jgi:hypothetical protein